jgi:hypothetical protein
MFNIKLVGRNGRAAWIICARYTEFKHTFKFPFLPIWTMFRF